MNGYIIFRQINYSRKLKKYDGFALFRYEYLFNTNLINENSRKELENINKE